MANKKKTFEDRRFTCKKCSFPVGLETCERQCLVIGSLAFFNFARFACLRCEAINGWQAPHLTDELQTFESAFPDDLRDLPKVKARFNKTGCVGVSQFGSKFRAVLCVNRKNIYLGLFDTLESASEAYKIAKERHSGKQSIPAGYRQKIAD